MARQQTVPLRVAFFVGVGFLLLFLAAVMLEPGILGTLGDALRGPAMAVDGNWVLFAAIAFPGVMLLFLLVLRGAV